MIDSRVTLNAQSTCSMEKLLWIQFRPLDANLSRSDAVEMGSATVPVATVGVSPTDPRRTITNQTMLRFPRGSLRRDAEDSGRGPSGRPRCAPQPTAAFRLSSEGTLKNRTEKITPIFQPQINNHSKSQPQKSF